MGRPSTYNIPIKPYIKKYIVKKFFSHHAAPFKLEENTLLGKQFMSVLIDGRKIDVIDKHLEMSDILTVKLSSEMMKRSPRLGKLITINFFTDKLFKEELIGWILSADFHGVRPYPASKNFLSFYDIDENEYSHDAAYRQWLNWKNADHHKHYKHPGGLLSQNRGTSFQGID